MRRSIVLIALAVTAGPAFAHETGLAERSSWAGDYFVEILLASLLTIYLVGLSAMLLRKPGKWPVGKLKVAAFFAAMLVLVAALLSPIETRAGTSFSVHMLQHLMLILMAAPLLAYSDAQLVILRAFPLGRRRVLGRAIASAPGVRWLGRSDTGAWLAAGFFVVTIWFWHIPTAYNWAVRHETVHAFEHVTMLLAAVLFWRVIITSGDRRLSPAMTVILVSLVGIQGSFLSALIMFAPHPLYNAYAGNPLDDQVLAGVLMCIPASFVYVGSTLWALSRMFGNGRRDAR